VEQPTLVDGCDDVASGKETPIPLKKKNCFASVSSPDE
jgi:hypothetical protein